VYEDECDENKNIWSEMSEEINMVGVNLISKRKKSAKNI
jgi:hypothetical protein